MKDEDLMILLVNKTNAILDSCNRFDNKIDNVASSMILPEADRFILINDLIDLCSNIEQFNTVISLIKIWPRFVDINEAGKKPWNNVLVKSIESQLPIINSVKELNRINIINDEDVVYLRGVLEAKESWAVLKVQFLKLALAYKNKGIIKK